MKKDMLAMINAEDKKNPYTDDQLANLLKVRRDEVTSLRNELEIPDSRKRREPYLLETFAQILANHPELSDRELTAEINKQGFTISRFTVAQIRKEFLLPANRMSKKQTICDPGDEDEQMKSAIHKKTATFRQIIGAAGTLKPQIQQAKAAVLYPPLGLHTLILGPTGSGKSYLAEAMYRYAVECDRISSKAKFVAFNCADYAENPQMLLSQLFGYVKGAFTGADAAKEGLVEQANGGVLFLDEIHRLPPEGQEILFHLIDKGKFRRMGETGEAREIQVLVIAATSEEVESSLLFTFRRRIPMVIELPPLAERTIGERYEMVREFLSKEADRIGVGIKVSQPVLRTMLLYDCQGNVGQLRSDIQVACARAFLTYLSERHKIVEIDLLDLPIHARRGLTHIHSRNQEVEKLLLGDLVVKPGEKGEFLPQMEDLYVLPREIYDFIERSYQDLQSRGVEQEEINRLIDGELEAQFRQFAQKFSHYDHAVAAQNLVDIVGQAMVDLAERMIEVAEKELGKVDRQLLYYLAIHIGATLERMQKGKPVINPQLEKVKNEYSLEYAVARKMIEAVQEQMEYILPEDEIGFIAMYLRAIIHQEDARQGRVGVLVMSHGKVAAGMVEVVNCLLGVNHAKALEMSLDERPEVALARAVEMVKNINEGKGVLLLADMGSLITFGELITQKTNIPTYTVTRVDTVMVLEAVRRAMLPDAKLNEIVETLDADKVGLGRLITPVESPEKKQKQVIITICITGEGTAQKFKRLIEKMVPEICDQAEIIALGITGKEDIYKSIEKIQAMHHIAAIIGSIRPQNTNIPFITVEEMLNGTAAARIRDILTLQSNPEEAIPPKSLRLLELVKNELILIRPDCKTKQEILDTLVKVLVDYQYVNNDFLLDVYKREVMGNTFLESGAAIPHGGLENVIKPAVAIAILAEPVPWYEGNMAKVVAMLALKEDVEQEVVYLINVLEDERFLRKLAAMETAEQVKSVLLENSLFSGTV
ncbi:sigma 54-interacting transcriptional regulator [Propionispora sp. 2/2-37]|uniref:sigma 54-interacting transcriptional regulator n=1 Tax=Propionispora sp. 2/2-37 TaxID=1677858 RepID=UPI0006BB6467|nr:sigma 54-interacting transcriptional regulator [Propionispora sp. 2/2-37]